MGNKRPHPGGGATGRDYENPDRKRLRTGHAPKPRPQKAHNADTDGLNAIKKRARAIERLLARDNLKLPANKLNDLERELAAHKLRIEDARTKKERSKMIQKYHMVRFFERKKAMRFAKQLEKKLAQATDPEEVSQLKSDLHIAQVDIDYAIYYPFMEAYISLYAVPKGDKEEKEEKDEKEEKGAAAKYLRNPRPPMWSVIEKTREKGEAALVKLQNRRPQQASDAKGAEKPGEKDAGAEKRVPATKGTKKGVSSQKAKASAKSRQAEEETGRAGDDDEDSDSDGGGFFE